jgi:fused signal recognition particle receptor
MSRFSRIPPTRLPMVSFFRRKKPESASTERRYTTEELAAAFPGTPASDAPPDTAGNEAVPGRTPPAAGDAPAAADTATATTPEPAAERPAPPMSAPLPPEILGAAMEAEAAGAPPEAPARAASPAPTEPDFSTLEFRTPEQIAAAAAPGRAGWRERLGGSAFARTFGSLFSSNPRLDDDLLDEIETALITADVGVSATTDLVDNLRRGMKAREFADSRAQRPVAVPLEIDPGAKPFVLLTVGVNGVGKTTTIGKLAHRFKDEGRTLMLAAGDTFRAAAVAQLQAWGDRNGVPVVAQGQNADAASVAYDALQAAKARGTQVLIADTAGRLHTQQGLMAELGKIKRVIRKLDADAPHEVLLVIDGTTGQNALSQLRQFHAAVGVTGLVVTKLDGTAKGGVVFALAREFGIPIRFAGIGERPEDLRVFDAEAFVDALLPESLGD